MQTEFQTIMKSSTGRESVGRREFVGKVALGMAGAAAVGAATKAVAQAATPTPTDVLQFGLNFEYLGAEFYLRAAYGSTAGLNDADTTGIGTRGAVTGGSQVPFRSNEIGQLARELARDEVQHVGFFRYILGAQQIARPAIDLVNSFTTFARSAGLVPANGTFNPFADEQSFLIGALILEDVCVTALKGGTPFIRSSPFLEQIAGVLATEGYQAGAIRSYMYMRGLYTQARQVSDLRDFFDGPTDIDAGIGDAAFGDLVPNDQNGLAFSRTPQQVLAIAYGSPQLTPGGFFPNGVNGTIR